MIIKPYLTINHLTINQDCHIISNDNVKSRFKPYLTINHFLDLSMHNHPFVLTRNHKCAHDNYHCIKGPRDIITFTHGKRDNYYFDNLTALDIFHICPPSPSGQNM